VNRVDVVIPCYQYGRYLAPCLASVLSQTGIDLRVLIIDDASTDETHEVASAAVAADARVEYRRHMTNRGHIATYNEGLLDWARGEYVTLVSADDLLAPGALARAAHALEEHPDVGLVYGRAVDFEDGRPLPESPSARASTSGPGRAAVRDGHEWIARRCRSACNVITSPEVVVRREVQQAVGGYVDHLPHTGDLEMWLRIASVTDIAHLGGVHHAYHRVHSRSMLRMQFVHHLDDLQHRRAAFAQFFRTSGTRLAHADDLHQQARRALAREALWRACRAYDRNELDQTPVTALVEFALESDPRAFELREYSGLRRRQRLGARFCSTTQVFVAPAIVRRVQRERSQRRWRRVGE
jgi:hypothetical protein